MMAERVGFEPTEPVKAHSISNAANSTTLAPFRIFVAEIKTLRSTFDHFRLRIFARNMRFVITD